VLARRLAVGGGEPCLRVGVSTGDMVREGGDWLGAAAIEASRLCAEAAGGSVLVADATVRLSRGRSERTLRLVGERVLRGFEVPVAVYELAAEHEDRSLPSELAVAGNVPLVGRRGELARTVSLLKTVAGGGSRILFVVGEPGVGKTRLAAAVALDAVSRGFTVLHGRCDEDLGAPYRPVVEAITPWLVGCPDAALPRIVGDGRDLVTLWPELAPRLGIETTGGGEDPEVRRWRLFEAVVGLLGSIAGEGPLLLVVDDLHWAEPSTLLLLRHLARRAAAGTAIVVTVRRGEPGNDAAALLGDIGTDRSLEIIDLGGLDRGEVAELVALHTGEMPPDDLSATLRVYTDGNPFFLAALLAHLEEEAFVRSATGVWVTAGDLRSAGVPKGVRGVIDRRLASLGSAARRVLDVAAVAGLAFDPRIIRDVLNVTLDETVAVLDAALAADLVRELETGRYEFVHALVRHAVLDELSRTRLASLHWRVAEAIERDDPLRLGEIAHHYQSGREMGNDATIVRVSLAAGGDALQRMAFEEAAGHLRTALAALDRMPPDPDLRYELLISLARALNALADHAEATRLCLEAADIARHAHDPERMFAAVVGYGYFVRLTNELEFVRLLDDLLDLLGPSDSPLRASALAWRAQLPRGNERVADDAVAMARRTRQTDALVTTLHARLVLATQSPDVSAMLRDAQEILEILDDAGPTTIDRAIARSFLTLAMLRVGNRADAEKHLALALSEAEQSGFRLSSHQALQVRSALETASGRFAEGKSLAAQAADRAGRHILVVQLSYEAQILAGRFEQGRLDTVIAALGELDSLDINLTGYHAMRASALASAGRNAEAAEVLDLIVNEFHRTIGRDPMALHHLSEVCRRLGDSHRATTLLAHATPWAGQILINGWGLSIEGASDRAIGHLLATLGRLDEADAAYTSAAELERSASFQPLVARTLYWHAQLLLERDVTGDRDRARALLDEVVDVADRIGMMQLHHEAASSRDRTRNFGLR
jgi:tetratricopeptide (TPR) repeat protein